MTSMKQKGTKKRVQMQNKRKSKLLCRTCLLEKDEADMKEIDDIGNMLKDIVTVQFVKKDGWPNNICSDCIIQASQAYQFRAMCTESHKILTERMAQKLKNKDTSDKTDTKGSDFNSKSQAKVCVNEEESSGVCVKNEEEDLGALTVEDVLFEFCEVQEEKESKMCEKEEESGIYEKEITNNDDTNDERNEFSIEENQNETTTTRKQSCCIFCDMKFNNESDLKQHRDKHLKERICFYCNSYLKSVGSYRIHVTRHKKQSTYPCKICDKSFKHFNNLKQHERIHSNAESYKCTKCDKTFSHAKSLKRHLASLVHSKVQPHVCNICAKQFTRDDHLNRHIKLQHVLPVDQRPYACDCGKSFRDKQYLAYHHKIVHTTIRTYECDLCKVSFKSCRSVNSHKKKAHKQYRPSS